MSSSAFEPNFEFSPNIAILVQDKKKAIQFYQSVLGIPLVKDHGPPPECGAEMKAGSNTLWIEEASRTEGKNVGEVFFEFYVRDLDAAITELERHGCQLGSFTSGPGFKGRHIQDRYGLRFHLFQRVGHHVEPKNPVEMKFTDTMMMAIDYEKLIRFYQEFVGLEVRKKTDHFAILVDPKTRQSLCITHGPSARTTAPGIEVENLDQALRALENHGGSVHRKWETAGMKGANCYDPENHEILVWQNSGA